MSSSSLFSVAAAATSLTHNMTSNIDLEETMVSAPPWADLQECGPDRAALCEAIQGLVAMSAEGSACENIHDDDGQRGCLEEFRSAASGRVQM